MNEIEKQKLKKKENDSVGFDELPTLEQCCFKEDPKTTTSSMK